MRVLLVQPSATRKKLIFLGLGYVAAAIEQRGDSVGILDLGLENNPDEALVKKVRETKPDIIGVSAVTPTYPAALKTLDTVKKILPSCITIIGGSHSSILTEEVVSELSVDIVVKGEGEITIVELLNALEKGHDLSEVKGISFKRNGQIVHNRYRPFINDLDSIPFPARHLYDVDKYSARIRRRRAAAVITSRGCPYDCVYCYRGPAAGKKFRCRSPENIINEIRLLKTRYGIEGIYFYDDIFTLNKKRAGQLCDLLIEEKLDILWTCQTRVDCVEPELLKKMKKAGCVVVGFGVESGNEKIMDLIKKINKEQTREAFKMTKEAGISSKASFILGLPWDTRETVQETIDFTNEIDPDFVDFYLATPFPGTKLWQIVEDKGVNLSTKWIDYNLNFDEVDWDTIIPLFDTKKLTKEELIHFFKMAHLKFVINKFKGVNSILRAIMLLFQRRGLLLSRIKSSVSMYFPSFKR